MKTRPKASDVTPKGVVAWERFIDADGVVKAIPDHVLVTSRLGNRGHHYALVCQSDTPLQVSDYGPFDPRAYRNVGTGGPVGASQVTSLLERHSYDAENEYRIAMRARLVGGLWVKLVDGIELDAAARDTLNAVPTSETEWLALVADIRKKSIRSMLSTATQTSLFLI